MKVEKQVCNLRQAILLNTWDIPKNSLFAWVSNDDANYKLIYRECDGNEYQFEHPAYTVAELGAMIPQGYSMGDKLLAPSDQWQSFGLKVKGTEAEVRAAILLAMLKSGELIKEQIDSALLP